MSGSDRDVEELASAGSTRCSPIPKGAFAGHRGHLRLPSTETCLAIRPALLSVRSIWSARRQTVATTGTPMLIPNGKGISYPRHTRLLGTSYRPTLSLQIVSAPDVPFCAACRRPSAAILAVVPRCLAASLRRSDCPDRPLQDDPPALRICPRDPRVARPVERSGWLHVIEGAQWGRKPNTHHVLGERLGQVLPVRGDQTEPVQLLFGRFL